jgi:hypothetical protein
MKPILPFGLMNDSEVVGIYAVFQYWEFQIFFGAGDFAPKGEEILHVFVT